MTNLPFMQLNIWQKSHQLTLQIYEEAVFAPREEKYEVIKQLKRAASSVGANIAEGAGRYYYKDKIRFYLQARGSLTEVQNFLLLCKDLKYFDEKMTLKLVSEYEDLAKGINSIISATRNKLDSN